MTLPRAVGLIVILSTIAIVAVWLRVERAQIAYRNHQLARQEIELTRAIDQAKSSIARLRAPERVQDRISKMQVSALPPESRSAANGSDRLAQNNR